MPSQEELIAQFELQPHPEGGWFREFYRSESATSIYYLLRAGEASWFHRLKQDEIWHHLKGDPVEIVMLSEARPLHSVLSVGAFVVPGGTWFAARPLGEFALCSCTVSPPFRYEEWEMANAVELQSAYPVCQAVIQQFEGIESLKTKL
ncbi:MAG: cupin domain-containing protein [Armatimonadetes bacterium]|nr:cupin domain-containing protein [Armatimonadota bacterium]